MFSTFEKIRELCKSRGISIAKLEENLGLSKNAIYAIKRNQPSAERLQEIADYFNVSTDYLLGRTEIPSIATGDQDNTISLDNIDEKVMLFDGKPLTDEERAALKGIIEGYLSTRK